MAKKVLIVDDDEINRDLIRKALKNEALELHEAIDGAQAIDKAREVGPDMLILDIMMPGKTGYEVCREIKEVPGLENIFILFLSARQGIANRNTAGSCGGDDFMAKPFSPKELREKVRQILIIKESRNA